MRPAETGWTIDLPQEPVGAGGSIAAPEGPMEGDGSTVVPRESIGACGSAAMPEVPMDGGGSAAAPQDTRETSPSVWEQGVGSKQPCPDEVEQGPRG